MRKFFVHQDICINAEKVQAVVGRVVRMEGDLRIELEPQTAEALLKFLADYGSLQGSLRGGPVKSGVPCMV